VSFHVLLIDSHKEFYYNVALIAMASMYNFVIYFVQNVE
jgi:hypothetical protein